MTKTRHLKCYYLREGAEVGKLEISLPPYYAKVCIGVRQKEHELQGPEFD